MDDFDIVDLLKRYELDDAAKEILNEAATILRTRASEIIEEAKFKIDTSTGPETQLDLLKTCLSTQASAVGAYEVSVSQEPLTDDRVAHLKAHVQEKYDLYHNWYNQEVPTRRLKLDMSTLQHTLLQQLDWLNQKISNNDSVKTKINQLVDKMSKHMETWPTETGVEDVVECLRTKVKGYDCVSQSLQADKIRLISLEESLQSSIKDVVGLIDRLLEIKKEYDVKLFKIYTIRQQDFPLLDAFLFNRGNATFSPDSWKLFFEVTRIVPINKLELLLAAQPISDITIVECRDQIQYAYLKTAEEGVIMVAENQWVTLMGPVKDQLDHDICWALVTAELVTAVRHLFQYDPDVVEFSCQDLVDFAAPEKRSERTKKGKKHFCYSIGLREGFEYVKVNGILREESRPFEAVCQEEVLPRHGSKLGYIAEVVSLPTVKDVLNTLRAHPVAGCIPVFEPEYLTISDQVFMGPTSPLSHYTSMHALNFVGAGGVEEGERHLNGRSSHGVYFGKDGYLKICYEHVIMCLTRGHYMRYIEDPVLLPCMFVYPKLLSPQEDQEKRRNKMIGYVFFLLSC